MTIEDDFLSERNEYETRISATAWNRLLFSPWGKGQDPLGFHMLLINFFRVPPQRYKDKISLQQLFVTIKSV